MKRRLGPSLRSLRASLIYRIDIWLGRSPLVQLSGADSMISGDTWSFKTTTPLMQQTRTTKRIKGGSPATLLSASTPLKILRTI